MKDSQRLRHQQFERQYEAHKPKIKANVYERESWLDCAKSVVTRRKRSRRAKETEKRERDTHNAMDIYIYACECVCVCGERCIYVWILLYLIQKPVFSDRQNWKVNSHHTFCSVGVCAVFRCGIGVWSLCMPWSLEHVAENTFICGWDEANEWKTEEIMKWEKTYGPAASITGRNEVLANINTPTTAIDLFLNIWRFRKLILISFHELE